MAFSDRFAITNFLQKEAKSSLSFSIDEFDDIVAVLLWIPNQKEHEHDHLRFDNDQLKTLVSLLTGKGGLPQMMVNYGWSKLSGEWDSFGNVGLIHLDTSTHKHGDFDKVK